jgi:hypothetical protein
MECPTQEDLLLHLVNDFEEQAEGGEIHEHLDACANCREKVSALERWLEALRQEGKRECDATLAGLADSLDGKTAALAEIDLPEHLGECEFCRALRRKLAEEFSYDEVLALDYPVPESLEQKIKSLLAANQDNSPIVDAVESLINKVDDLVDRIVLVLTPAPAPAFLGNPLWGTAQIETTEMRDLKVDISEPERLVKIFSADDIELGRQISDQNGVVVFKDFVPATYKLLVEGFEIKDVTVWP